MKPIIYILTAGLLFVASQVFGQAIVTSLTPATVTAPIGGTVDLQLKVTNFSNINSLQFPITYNSSVLQFVSIDNAALPGFTNGNYNATNGKVTISWFADPGAYPSGFSIADNSSIFTLHFTVLTNGSATVNIANQAPGIEVIRNGAPVNLNFANGGSQVTGGSGGPAPTQGFSIIANTIYIPQGTTGCMPVTVNDFTNIISMQYAMHWDNTVLQYQNTQSYNLTGLTAANFGGTPATGLQLVGWDDPGATGVTRANGTKIYDVCFQAIGPVGSQSLITIDSIGFPAGNGSAEAFNAASQNVWKSNSGVTDTIFVVTAPPPANAVTFTADQDTANTGSQVCVDIFANNFNSVISMQYGVTYDATKLTFVSVTPNPNVPGLTAASFNANTPGQIRLSWSDPAALGVTLPANTLLFTVCFTVAAPPGSLVPVNFGSLPGLPVEIVKEPDGPVNPAFANGHVYVPTVAAPDGNVNAKPACGGNTGSVTFQATSGTPTSYAWSAPGSGNTQSVNNLAAGSYTVTVTFAGGQTVVRSGTVDASPAMSLQTTQVQNIKCNNQNNGQINLTATGGTTPYTTYSWSGPNNYTSATEDLAGLSAGIYSVTVTDSKQCTISQNFTITNPAALILDLATSQNVTCFGADNGKITINSGGGTAPLSYAWYEVPGGGLASNIKNPSTLGGGTYNVTITDANSCTTTLANPVTINEPSSALSVASPVQKTDLVCWGYSNGSINLNISGGWGNYTVNWGSFTGASITGIPGGNYVPTITDAGNCSLTLPAIQVNEPPAVSYGTPAVVHNLCAGDGDGSISVQVSGGNDAPYTVQWGPALFGENIANLDGGLYVPTITDGDGCTAILPGIQVNEPAAIDTGFVIMFEPSGSNDDGAISPDVNGGAAPLTYSWTGPAGFTANTEDIASLAAGQYNLTVTDANNCFFTASFQLGDALSAIVTATASCGNDGCMNIDIAAGTPPFLISWVGTSSGLATSNTNTANICTFGPGIYNLTIADAANNTLTINGLNVDALSPALVSSSKTNPTGNLSNGSITVTPIPDTTSMSYSWTGPNGFTSTSGNLTGLATGTYSATVTNDNSGCTSVYSFNLTPDWPALVVATSNTANPTCVTSTNGSISISVNGGNPGPPSYSYSWSGPNGFAAATKDLSGLLPGTYNLTVTDANGTSSTVTATLTAQSLLAISNVNETSSYGNPPYQVSGFNQCDGIASVVIAGAVGTPTIVWSNNVTGAQNNSLCGGQYSVTVTDGLGCVSVWSDSLTYPAPISTGIVAVSEVSCHGECDAVIRVNLSGGVAPYTVNWSTGQTDQVANSGGFSQAVNLCGGDYSVTVTDKLGASYTFPISVNEPAALVINFASVEPTTFNSCNGEIIADAPGAVEPITYAWSGNYGHSGDNQRAEGLCSGEIVEFVITDGNGCIGVGRDTIPYPEDGCYQVRPVITPGQQDGNNDYVHITCIEAVPNSIEIYNRWGQLVYEATNYDNSGTSWKGLTKNGLPLAEGVYYYILNYTDPVRGPEQQKGHINLLR